MEIYDEYIKRKNNFKSKLALKNWNVLFFHQIIIEKQIGWYKKIVEDLKKKNSC